MPLLNPYYTTHSESSSFLVPFPTRYGMGKTDRMNVIGSAHAFDNTAFGVGT